MYIFNQHIHYESYYYKYFILLRKTCLPEDVHGSLNYTKVFKNLSRVLMQAFKRYTDAQVYNILQRSQQMKKLLKGTRSQKKKSGIRSFRQA